jgi:hypothetical protein
MGCRVCRLAKLLFDIRWLRNHDAAEGCGTFNAPVQLIVLRRRSSAAKQALHSRNIGGGKCRKPKVRQNS